MTEAPKGGLSPDFSLADEVNNPQGGHEEFGLHHAVTALNRLNENDKAKDNKIQGLQEENRELQQRLELDAKTGLLNYTTFVDKVKARLATGGEDQSSVKEEGGENLRTHRGHSLIIFDIDDFKMINKVLGYQDADAICLIPTAEKIKTNLHRGGDAITHLPVGDKAKEAGRFGGEEFIVYLEGADEEGARVVAERIKNEINKISFTTPQGKQTLGISVGIASALPNSDTAYEEVFDQANQALARAKELEGKNQIITFTQQTDINEAA